MVYGIAPVITVTVVVPMIQNKQRMTSPPCTDSFSKSSSDSLLKIPRHINRAASLSSASFDGTGGTSTGTGTGTAGAHGSIGNTTAAAGAVAALRITSEAAARGEQESAQPSPLGKTLLSNHRYSFACSPVTYVSQITESTGISHRQLVPTYIDILSNQNTLLNTTPLRVLAGFL